MEPNILRIAGQVAGIGGLALGVFLLLFRQFIRQRIFRALNQKQSYKILVLFLVLVWSVAVLGVIAWVFTPERTTDSQQSFGLINNGGFEQGYSEWGTGYYEQRDRSLSGFWASWVDIKGVSQPVKIRADIVSDIVHSGDYSLQISSNIEVGPNRYGTISQRITGLDENSKYEVRFWARVLNAAPMILRLVSNQAWTEAIELPSGTYDWQEFVHTFDTNDRNEVDVRFLSSARGIVWIDDVSMKRIVN